MKPLGLLLLACVAFAADPPVLRVLTMTAGKGELLQFDADVERVAVSEPKIADAVVVSQRDVMVNAKSAGQTTFVIWEKDSTPIRYEVTVLSDRLELDLLQRSWTAQFREAFPNIPIDLTGNTESLVLTGKATLEQSKRAEAIASTFAKKVTNLIEVPDRKQILLQVTFASVDRTALEQFGVNLVSRNAKMLGAATTQQFPPPLFTQLQFQDQAFRNSNLNLSNLLNLFIFRPDLNLGATITALKQQNLLQILAEPNLIVKEGSEASFLAGGEFPFPTISSTPTQGGVAPVITVTFKKFGVQLGFLPTETSTGAINLKVKPEVSALDFTNAVTLQGFLIPAISSRQTETEVTLKDGESFAIAGLIDNRVSQIMNRVWGLGDIPIIGHLFRSRSTQKTTDELLVVVTPRFVRPLDPDQKVELPETVLPFLPTVAEQKAAEAAKKKSSDEKDQPKPEFAGPRGHEVPR